MLTGRHVMIVLMDKRLISALLATSGVSLPAMLGLELGYQGHYVLIVGFDVRSAEYLVKDPAASQETVRVPAARLDQARRAFGTDEDLLIVDLEASPALHRRGPIQ